MQTPMWAEVFGWYGTVAILGGYALTSLAILDTNQPRHRVVYQALNLTGALGIVTVSYYHHAWQPAALNACWAVIALVALVRPPAGRP